jgi:hypothetical protein
MKKVVLLILLAALAVTGAFFVVKKYGHLETNSTAEEEDILPYKTGELQDGDIIFQTSLSAQSKAIQIATKSKYSHCGIIYKQGGKCFVYEAIQPVILTPFEKWTARGKGGHYVVKRLRDAREVLTTEVLTKMKAAGEEFRGKNYDLAFEWSDDKIYCSELVWKIYQRGTALEVGKLEKLKDLDLSNPVVQWKLKQRYGDYVPMDETVVSPQSIFDSPLLTTVWVN